MPRKVITDVVREHNNTAKSSLLDSEETRPHFLSRNKERGRFTDLGTIQVDKPRRRKWLWWLVILLLIAVLFFTLSSLFASVTVKVIPRQESVAIDAVVETRRNSSQSEGVLLFQTIKLFGEVSTTLESTGTKFVERKATGKITIFNEYGTANLKLIPNTRFEAQNGNIYRVQNAVTVPGYKTFDGVKVPGSLEISVIAEEPGAQYNIGPAEFTLPGLKDDPQYKTVYARSKEPISGGATGEVHVVDEVERMEAEKNLMISLETKLLNEISTAVPDGFVVIEDANQVLFDPVHEAPSVEDDSLVVLSQTGTLYAFVLENSQLAKFLAERTISLYSGEEITISNIKDLVFDVSEEEKNSVISSDSVEIAISGHGVFVWDFDSEKLSQELAGSKKKEYEAVFENYPTIERAEVFVRPPWKRSFPKNPEKIKVEIILDRNSE